MKKLSWLVAALSIAMLVSAKESQAQASVYGEGTANYLNNGPYTDFLSGGVAGVLINLTEAWHERIIISADVQGNFVLSGTEPTGYSNNETYDAITLGPRFSLTPHFFKLAPYVQFNAGFGRYHDPNVHSATDNVFGVQGGVTRRLTSRFDGVLDYSYSRFGYNANYYSPQTFSIGALYHFSRR